MFLKFNQSTFRLYIRHFQDKLYLNTLDIVHYSQLDAIHIFELDKNTYNVTRYKIHGPSHYEKHNK